MPTPAVKHTCSGNLGIVKILRYIKSDIVKNFVDRKMDPLGQRGPLFKHT